MWQAAVVWRSLRVLSDLFKFLGRGPRSAEENPGAASRDWTRWYYGEALRLRCGLQEQDRVVK